MVIQPRDEIYEPLSVFRSTLFVRDLPPKTGSRDALRACSSLRGCRVRGGLAARRCFHCTCRATSEAALPQLWHGCSVLREFPLQETQTTLRGHPCCDAHGRLRDALRREAPERGRWPAIEICPTQPFPTGLQAPGARRWPRLPVPPSLAERMPSLAGTASKEAIHSESQAPGCSAQLS